MELSWVSELPEWVLAGFALGALLAALVTVTFAVGTRRFPDAPGASTGRDPSTWSADGGESRRRAEIRQFLHAIGEPFDEDRRIAGRIVAFYLPNRDLAVTFDARDYFELERTGAQVVLVEFELPGASLGGRLPFKTPAIEPIESPDTRAFARLGLSPSASRSAVRAAYRERVKLVHPDRGGDRTSFAKLREAYTTALERTESTTRE